MQEDRFQYKLVVVVRSDLKLSPGKMAVQVANAAVGCALECRERSRKKFDAWLKEGQRKVVVRVKSLSELHMTRESARGRGLITSLVADAGLTEVPPGTVTCLGIGPAGNEEVDPVTGGLQLL